MVPIERDILLCVVEPEATQPEPYQARKDNAKQLFILIQQTGQFVGSISAYDFAHWQGRVVFFWE